VTIKQMDKAAARFLHDEVRAALKAVAWKHGLDFKDGAGRYNPAGGSFSFKGEFTLQQIGGEDREVAEFKSLCELFHLTPADYEKEFTFRGEQYRLTGFYPSSPKFAYRGKRIKDGKVYKFPSDVLKQINPAAYTEAKKLNEPFFYALTLAQEAAAENAANAAEARVS
jgi:hypothetical protein